MEGQLFFVLKFKSDFNIYKLTLNLLNLYGISVWLTTNQQKKDQFNLK